MKKRANPSSVTKFLKHIRTTFGWSQKRLAMELWVSPATIAHWETGNRKPVGPSLKLIQMYHSAANEAEFYKYAGMRPKTRKADWVWHLGIDI